MIDVTPYVNLVLLLTALGLLWMLATTLTEISASLRELVETLERQNSRTEQMPD